MSHATQKIVAVLLVPMIRNFSGDNMVYNIGIPRCMRHQKELLIRKGITNMVIVVFSLKIKVGKVVGYHVLYLFLITDFNIKFL